MKDYRPCGQKEKTNGNIFDDQSGTCLIEFANPANFLNGFNAYNPRVSRKAKLLFPFCRQ